MLTQIERSILLIARHRILKGDETYLCYAIMAALNGRTSSHFRLTNYVQMMIHPHHTLESWQYSNGLGNRSSAQNRQDRLDWIDWMLSEEE
jgi:hypothetical protein